MVEHNIMTKIKDKDKEKRFIASNMESTKSLHINFTYLYHR